MRLTTMAVVRRGPVTDMMRMMRMRMIVMIMKIRMMMKRMMRLTRVAVVRRGPVTDMRVSSGHSIHLH